MSAEGGQAATEESQGLFLPKAKHPRDPSLRPDFRRDSAQDDISLWLWLCRAVYSIAFLPFSNFYFLFSCRFSLAIAHGCEPDFC